MDKKVAATVVDFDEEAFKVDSSNSSEKQQRWPLQQLDSLSSIESLHQQLRQKHQEMTVVPIEKDAPSYDKYIYKEKEHVLDTFSSFLSFPIFQIVEVFI